MFILASLQDVYVAADYKTQCNIAKIIHFSSLCCLLEFISCCYVWKIDGSIVTYAYLNSDSSLSLQVHKIHSSSYFILTSDLLNH